MCEDKKCDVCLEKENPKYGIQTAEFEVTYSKWSIIYPAGTIKYMCSDCASEELREIPEEIQSIRRFRDPADL